MLFKLIKTRPGVTLRFFCAKKQKDIDPNQEIGHIHVDMKLKNAKNKLEKSGFAVRIKPWNCYKAEREFGKYVIEFHANCDGDVDHFSVRRKDDFPDMQSDYCPYFFFDTCKRAIEFASR